MTNKESNKKKKIIITILAIIIIIILLLLKCCSKKKDTGSVTQEDTTSTQEVIENNDKKEEVKEEETKEEVIVIEEEKPVDGYSYYVNFLNIDGTLLQRSVYKKGEIPSYKGSTPTYSAGLSTYTFTGWDKAFTKVSGTQTYTATYNVSAHTCSHYTIQSDGSWLCSECNALLKDTDDAYFTVLDANDQPTDIIKLTEENVTLTSGISKSGTNISYSNNSSTAQDVVIRTNTFGTILNINGNDGDTVAHYGFAGLVEVTKVAMSSYDEYGTVGRICATATDAKGHIDIKKGATVYQIEQLGGSSTKVSIDTNATVYDINHEKITDVITNETVKFTASSSTVVDSTKIGNAIGDTITASACKHENCEDVVDGHHVYEVCKSCGYTLIKVDDIKKTVANENNENVIIPKASYDSSQTVAGSSNGDVQINKNSDGSYVTPSIAETPTVISGHNTDCNHKHSFKVIDNEDGTHTFYCDCGLKYTENCDHYGDKGICSKCQSAEVIVTNPNDNSFEPIGMSFVYFKQSILDTSTYNNYLELTVTLQRDIDLSNANMDLFRANTSEIFAGTLNGNNHSILGFNNICTDDNMKYASLFYYLYNATIKDLTIKDSTFDYANHASSFIAYQAYGDSLLLDNVDLINCDITNGFVNQFYIFAPTSDVTTIKNCSVDSTSSMDCIYGNYGCWFRQVCYTDFNMIDCVNNAPMRGRGFVGAFVGQLGTNVYNASFTNCINNGDITVYETSSANGRQLYCGGFIGYKNSSVKIAGEQTITFTNCQSNGDIIVEDVDGNTGFNGGSVGGYIGYTNGTTLIFNNCQSNGNVGSSLIQRAAGYVGWENGTSTITLTNCSQTGDVSANSINGIAGVYVAGNNGTTNMSSVDSSSSGTISAKTITKITGE